MPEVTGRRAGRRYTLTEGDFHHLKNARLTHLHLPPLKIVTIHECDSGEASATATPHPTVAPKASLAIFQVSQVSGGPELRGGTTTPPPPSRHHLAHPHPPPPSGCLWSHTRYRLGRNSLLPPWPSIPKV